MVTQHLILVYTFWTAYKSWAMNKTSPTNVAFSQFLTGVEHISPASEEKNKQPQTSKKSLPQDLFLRGEVYYEHWVLFAIWSFCLTYSNMCSLMPTEMWKFEGYSPTLITCMGFFSWVDSFMKGKVSTLNEPFVKFIDLWGFSPVWTLWYIEVCFLNMPHCSHLQDLSCVNSTDEHGS